MGIDIEACAVHSIQFKPELSPLFFSPPRVMAKISLLLDIFFAESDAATEKWLQIDLGREYEVKTVVIFPVLLADATTGLADRKQTSLC